MLSRHACKLLHAQDKQRTRALLMQLEKLWQKKDRKLSGKERLVSNNASFSAYQILVFLPKKQNGTKFVTEKIELDCRFFLAISLLYS